MTFEFYLTHILYLKGYIEIKQYTSKTWCQNTVSPVWKYEYVSDHYSILNLINRHCKKSKSKSIHHIICILHTQMRSPSENAVLQPALRTYFMFRERIIFFIFGATRSRRYFLIDAFHCCRCWLVFVHRKKSWLDVAEHPHSHYYCKVMYAHTRAHA